MAKTPKPLVGIIMGSQSDWETMQNAAAQLESLGVPFEAQVVSAHRTPDLLFDYASSAAKRGLELPGLQVRATGTYEGMRFARIAMAVIADVPPGVLEGMIPHAERVCYVTNTLRHGPQLEVSVGSTDDARRGGENAQ